MKADTGCPKNLQVSSFVSISSRKSLSFVISYKYGFMDRELHLGFAFGKQPACIGLYVLNKVDLICFRLLAFASFLRLGVWTSHGLFLEQCSEITASFLKLLGQSILPIAASNHGSSH